MEDHRGIRRAVPAGRQHASRYPLLGLHAGDLLDIDDPDLDVDSRCTSGPMPSFR
jgi:hypothetical protein